MRHLNRLLFLSSAAAVSASAVTLSFEGVSLTTPPATVYPGPGGGVFYNGSDSAGGFTAAGAFFANQFTDWGGGFTSWTGWAYSTTSDASTGGFGNQYSAYLPAPASRPYAVGYADGARITLPPGLDTPVSARVANTTYTARSMLNGDGFNDAFSAGDWFFVELVGRNSLNAETGRSRLYLGDFRSANPSEHGVVSDWVLLDLAALGSSVVSIELVFGSSDSGSFGVNTPTYIALDALSVVPEPASLAALAGALALALALRNRRSS